MKLAKRFIPAFALLITAAAPALRADDQADLAKRLTEATRTLQEATPDRSAISEARCVGVVPNLTEAAFVAGGKHGNGVATCKDGSGAWSAPIFFSLSGGSIGAQAGVERKDIVILAMTEKGKERFQQREFDLGAGAEATGGDRSARADWQGRDVAVFTSAKGAFAGANVSGTVFHRDDDAMTTVYGKNAQADAVLNGNVKAPAMAAGFLKQVEQLQSAGPRSAQIR